MPLVLRRSQDWQTASSVLVHLETQAADRQRWLRSGSLHDSTALAIQKLADIAEHGQSEMAQIAAANALLDRGWGRPTQPVSGDDEMPPVGIGWGALHEAERDQLIAVLIEGLRQEG